MACDGRKRCCASARAVRRHPVCVCVPAAAAIRFVLNDSFINARAEERLALLHVSGVQCAHACMHTQAPGTRIHCCAQAGIAAPCNRKAAGSLQKSTHPWRWALRCWRRQLRCVITHMHACMLAPVAMGPCAPPATAACMCCCCLCVCVCMQEGAGHRVASAWVEIVFDNSDGRFPVSPHACMRACPHACTA